MSATMRLIRARLVFSVLLTALVLAARAWHGGV